MTDAPERVEVLWKPQPGPQTIAASRPEFELLYGGAKGGGKTDLLLFGGLRQIDKPKYHAVLFRRNFTRLKEIKERSFRVFPKLGGRWNGQDNCWRFPPGARYTFAHLQHERDKWNWQGQEIHYLAFDQLEEFTQTQYEFLVMQVRTSDPTIQTCVRATANPGGVGHVWVKARFIDNKVPFKTYRTRLEVGLDDCPHIELTSIFIPARVWDNKILLKADPRYLAVLKSLPEDMRRAFLEGDWDVFVGQFFDEFRRERDGKPWHVVKPHEIPPHVRRFRSIDWGYGAPCCVLWHYMDGYHLVTYRELYVQRMKASDVAKRVVELTGDEEIDYTVISPDAWREPGNERDGIVGEPIAETFAKHGVPVMPADNRRKMGWTQLREYLAEAPDGRPYWSCFSTCLNLIRTLPGLVHDEHDPEDADDSGEDHAPEALRYAVMSRPRPAALVEPEPPPDSLAARIREITKEREREETQWATLSGYSLR